MKKQLKRISVFMFAMTLISVTSCNKEKLSKPNVIEDTKERKIEDNQEIIDNIKPKEYCDDNDYSQLKVLNNKTLEFVSIEYYGSFLKVDENPRVDYLMKYLEKINFSSLKKLNKSLDDKDDDFIFSILDENQIVKIGKWFIKLNFDNSKVYASSANNAYDLLQQEDEQSKDVYVFSFEDEVLEILSNDELLGQKSWFNIHRCSDRKAYHKYNENPYQEIESIGGDFVGVDLRSSYNRYGIYFSLTSVSHVATSIDLNELLFWFYLSDCSRTIRCGNSINHYTYPTNYPSSNVESLGSSEQIHMRTLKYKWYAGFKQLKNYDYKVKIRVDDYLHPDPNQINDYTNNFRDSYSTFVHISDY